MKNTLTDYMIAVKSAAGRQGYTKLYRTASRTIKQAYKDGLSVQQAVKKVMED